MIERLTPSQQAEISAAIFAGNKSEAIRLCDTAVYARHVEVVREVEAWTLELLKSHPEKFESNRPHQPSSPVLHSPDQSSKTEIRAPRNESLDKPYQSSPSTLQASNQPSKVENRAPKNEKAEFSAQIEKLAAGGKVQRRNIAQILTLKKHGYVLHRSWGLGKIKSVDTIFSRVIIDFEVEPNHAFDLDFAAQILKPVSDPPAYRAAADIEVRKLNWKLLGPGELTLERIIRYLDSLRHGAKEVKVNTSRVSFVLDQKPDQVFVGLDEFDGYLAFIFEKAGKAVMENPHEGNAIYVFGQDWKQLSRLTKTEIMHSRWNYERLVHTGEWEQRLLRCLRHKRPCQ